MSNVILLDGGMGQELVKRSKEPPTALWSTRVLIDQPEIVQAVHEEYIEAGARIITLNSYAVLRDRLARFGIEDRLEELQLAACRLANQARDAKGRDVAIAGSLGPLGWSYRPDLTFPEDESAETYAEIAKIQAPHVDLIICETMSSIGQARGALKGAGVAGKPVWLSVSVDDTDGTQLRSGELVSGLAAAVADLRCDGFLINCSLPEAVGRGIPLLPRNGLPTGGYGNGFHAISSEYVVQGATVDELVHRHDMTPELYAEHCLKWVADGATVVGGCCETGPAHIAHLRQRLLAAGHQIAGVSR